MRRASRTDSNQEEIINALWRAGYSVRCTSGYGNGFPDLMVKSKADVIVLLEVKVPGAKLTPAEREFQEWYTAPYHIVRSAEEAIDTMGDYDERC